MVRQIRRKVRAVQVRLVWIALCRRYLTALCWSGGLLALYVLAGRLVPLGVRPVQIAPWLAGAAAVWVVAWTWLRRVRLLEAAVRADEALGLKERLSTALAIPTPRSQAEAAVLEDAAEHARAIRPSRAFPMGLGRPAGRAMVTLALLAGLWLWMPQLNLLAKAKPNDPSRPTAAVEAHKEAVAQLEDMAKELAKTDKVEKSEISQKLERDLNALAKQIKDQKLTGEQAAAKMEKLGEKITARRDEIEKMMEKTASMQSRGEGRNTAEMAKALQKGDFAKAAKALDDLKKKLQAGQQNGEKNGQMSQEQKEALAKEIKQMSEQLGKDSPLGEALRKAAENMKEGQMNGALAELENATAKTKEMESMLAELKELEGLEHDMEGREKALSGQPVLSEGEGMEGMTGMDGQSLEQMRGQWRAGDEREQGNGMGGPGIGQGAVAESKEGPTAFEKKRIKGDIQPGDILARMKVAGRQPPGEIKTQFEALRLESSQVAEDTVKGEQLPLERKALVRQYFDAIKMDAPAQGAAAKPAPVATPGATPK